MHLITGLGTKNPHAAGLPKKLRKKKTDLKRLTRTVWYLRYIDFCSMEREQLQEKMKAVFDKLYLLRWVSAVLLCV